MFNIGDIVFAKVKGFNWWPGKITEYFNSNDSYRIDFYEKKKTYCILKENSIKEFSEGYKMVNQKKISKLLKDSINKAYKEYGFKNNNLLHKKRNFDESNCCDKYDTNKIENQSQKNNIETNLTEDNENNYNQQIVNIQN